VTQTHALTFDNKAGPVLILWLASNGTEVPFVRLGAGEQRAAKTYTGDAWRVRGIQAKWPLLLEMQVGPLTIRDCGCLDRPLVVCPPRERRPPNASDAPSEPVGFVNTAAVPVHLYVASRPCEVLLTEGAPIAPGGQRMFHAWAGQTFRVRAAATARMLLEVNPSSAVISPCALPPIFHGGGDRAWYPRSVSLATARGSASASTQGPAATVEHRAAGASPTAAREGLRADSGSGDGPRSGETKLADETPPVLGLTRGGERREGGGGRGREGEGERARARERGY